MISNQVTGLAMCYSSCVVLIARCRPGVGARVPAGRGFGQARQEVLPALGEGAGLAGRQVAVSQPDDRAVAVRDQVDLARAGAGRQRRAAPLPAPGEDDPPVRDDLDVLTADDVPA